jgi:hypothetical protein
MSSTVISRVAPETNARAPLASSALPEGKTLAQIAGYPEPEATPSRRSRLIEPEGHTHAQSR